MHFDGVVPSSVHVHRHADDVSKLREFGGHVIIEGTIRIESWKSYGITPNDEHLTSPNAANLLKYVADWCFWFTGKELRETLTENTPWLVSMQN